MRASSAAKCLRVGAAVSLWKAPKDEVASMLQDDDVKSDRQGGSGHHVQGLGLTERSNTITRQQ